MHKFDNLYHIGRAGLTLIYLWQPCGRGGPCRGACISFFAPYAIKIEVSAGK
uniref:Uncharacterized protein n=1 Tax=Klebsiella pneumoniae TaxID=573 RepID=A0A8B0SY52_KLEPN|nr:hypothetical protein [Klebsiella pneumoniae]